MFTIGKTIKYTLWISFALFWYHMYLLKKTEKPEQGFLANQVFLDLAKSADWHFYDLKLLLTRPPVEKLLPDRPPLPPGAGYPKTLVLNLRGTLIHSEYKVFYFCLYYVNLAWSWFRNLKKARSKCISTETFQILRNCYLRRWRERSNYWLNLYFYRWFMRFAMLLIPNSQWYMED